MSNIPSTCELNASNVPNHYDNKKSPLHFQNAPKGSTTWQYLSPQVKNHLFRGCKLQAWLDQDSQIHFPLLFSALPSTVCQLNPQPALPPGGKLAAAALGAHIHILQKPEEMKSCFQQDSWDSP